MLETRMYIYNSTQSRQQQSETQQISSFFRVKSSLLFGRFIAFHTLLFFVFFSSHFFHVRNYCEKSKPIARLIFRLNIFTEIRAKDETNT